MIVIDFDVRRRDWKVGRIVCIYFGVDGFVCVVDVKVGDKILKRFIIKLLLLEM